MIKLIEKIEGEAKLHFSFNDNKIDFVDIEFMQTRYIENILKGRPPLDALVINPRVCGICGHSHLIATVKALENCYDDIPIPNNAKIIRELTLNFELIQNHFKWFYMTILPLLGQRQQVLKATLPASLMAKAIALFGGQYPHTSYAIVGGVVCAITNADLIKIEQFLNEALKFFRANTVKADTDEFLACENTEDVLNKNGDLPKILRQIKKNNWQNIGRSYDRFLVFGSNGYFKEGKSLKTKLSKNISIDGVKEFENQNSYAKNVKYKDKYYEVGPLSRAMINKTPLIKDAHRRYGDSIFSRLLARVCEIPELLSYSKQLIKEINPNEPMYIKPPFDITNATGHSAVEASRGSLIHKVIIEDAIIKNYDIITPTLRNLSNGTKEEPGVSQKAMLGLKDAHLAELVFKTFDVCSVCTTH